MARRWGPRLLLGLVVLVAVAAILLVRSLPGLERAGAEVAPAEALPVLSPHFTSGAWYEVGFTDPKFPDDRANHRGGIDGRLVRLIDSAQRTVDVAIYDLDLETVSEAMARAARRGVRVRAVTESDTLNNKGHRFIQAAFAALQAAEIPVVDDKRRQLMHDKFTVVDGEWVQTGSWNYTDADTYRHNNNAVVVQSQALAANYGAEFDKMFVQEKFGASKPKGTVYGSLPLAGALVETYFSPQDSGAAQIIRWIGAARQRIHFMAFSFTHDGIGEAMLERARAGVEVAGVFESRDSGTQFSEYPRLKREGLDVVLDGNPWLMHHKVIIIDDRITVSGSFNYSQNADRQNDENLLIVDDVSLAAAFEAEYQRVRRTAQNPPGAR